MIRKLIGNDIRHHKLLSAVTVFFMSVSAMLIVLSMTLSVGDVFAMGGQELVIAGFIRDAQMNSMMASSKRFLVNAADYERLLPQGEEEYLIEFLLEEGADASVFATAYATEGLPANGPTITRPLIRIMNALSDGMMIFVILLVGLVVLLISIFCIHFILSIGMEKDRKEVGMLKAIGIGKKEIRRLYFSKYILFSAGGGLTGLLAAFLMKASFEKKIDEMYGVADWNFGVVLISLLAVVVSEGIILLSIRHALKKLDKLSALEALFSSKISEKNRKFVGYLPIGAVVAACTFLMVVPQNLYSTLSSPAFVTYMGIGDGEIRIDIRQTEDIVKDTEQMVSALENDIEVDKYAVLVTKSYPVILPDGERINLIVETGNHSIFPVSCQAGHLPVESGDIALSSLYAQELGVNVGDALYLLLDDEKVPYRISGIYSDITNGGKTAKTREIQDDRNVMWSILYVSLKNSAGKEFWVERYRQSEADVTDIANYVQETYGPTLEQIRLAAKASVGISVLVIVVVVILFMKLLVEKNRYSISLRKALGFTSRQVRQEYLVKGILSAAFGMSLGILLGNLCGESLCGMILKSFGSDGFQFVVAWKQVLFVIPEITLPITFGTLLLGVWDIAKIKAWECCTGKE